MPHQPHRAIAAARALVGQSQADLARELTAVKGETWTRGMVANLETGAKKLDVDTLLAIAAIQGYDLRFYTEGPQRSSTNSAIPGYGNHGWTYDELKAYAEKLLDEPHQPALFRESPYRSWHDLLREQLEQDTDTFLRRIFDEWYQVEDSDDSAHVAA